MFIPEIFAEIVSYCDFRELLMLTQLNKTLNTTIKVSHIPLKYASIITDKTLEQSYYDNCRVAYRTMITINGLKLLNLRRKTSEKFYEGDITKIDLRKQKTNYDMLQMILKVKYNTSLSYVMFREFTFDPRGHAYEFIATNPEETVVWRKYEANVAGGGTNHVWLYENNSMKKYKLSKIIKENSNLL